MKYTQRTQIKCEKSKESFGEQGSLKMREILGPNSSQALNCQNQIFPELNFVGKKAGLKFGGVKIWSFELINKPNSEPRICTESYCSVCNPNPENFRRETSRKPQNQRY
jgi:hypothetical protein